MKDTIKPSIITVDKKPINRGKSGNAQINDNGMTYNEAGITYNELGLTYGGIYGISSGIKPTISTAHNFTSSSGTASANRRGQPMGFLLLLTYPS